MNETNVLDQLKDINWNRDKLPVINFLNLTEEELEKSYKTSELKQDFSLDEIKSFHRGVSFVLKSLSEGKDTKAVEDFLTKKWVKAHHSIVVEGKDVFMQAYSDSDDFLNDFWLSFICHFLYSKWYVRMAECPVCGRWFYRAKKDKIYCSKSCKNKADYYKHQERRLSERRERYHREPSVD